MKQEQVLQWARAAELIDPRDRAEDPYVIHMLPSLLRFAKLVAAHEREACAQIVDAKEQSIYIYTNTAYLQECASEIRARGSKEGATCN